MALCSVDRDLLLSLWPTQRVLLGASTCHLLRSILSKSTVVRLNLKSNTADGALSTDSLCRLLGFFSGTVLLSCPSLGSDEVFSASRSAMAAGWAGPCGLDIVRVGVSPVPSTLYSDLQATFSSCQNLQCISLYNLHLGAEGAEKFGAALEHLDGTKLVELELGGNSMQDAGLICICMALLRCNATNLEHLRLSLNEITENGAIQLAEALPHILPLRELVLGRNRICDAGMERLAHALRDLPALTYIDLGGNHIGTEGADWLAELGGPICTHTMESSATENSLAAAGNGCAVAGCGLTSLTALDLSYNRLGVGARHLGAMLSQCRNLTDLDLTCNEVGELDESMDAVCGVLRRSVLLASVRLGGSKMGDRGASKLAAAVDELVALRHLSVRGNAVSDKGTCVLVQSLEACCRSTLETLDLAFNRIQHASCSEIGERLGAFGPQLRRVDLSYNWMGHLGMLALADALTARRGCQLRSLLLDGNCDWALCKLPGHAKGMPSGE